MSELELYEQVCSAISASAHPSGKEAIIAFYPGKSEQAVKLAKRLALEGICQPLLLGPELAIFDLCVKHHVNPDSLYGIVDPAQPVNLASYVASYLTEHTEVAEKEAIAEMKKPAVFAALLIARKEADVAIDLDALPTGSEAESN